MTPTADHRRTSVARRRALHRGLDAVVHGWMRCSSNAEKLRAEAELLHRHAASLAHETDAQVQSRLRELQSTFRRGEKLDDEVVHAALAAVAESARRQLGLQPYAVQLMGALAVWRGMLLEMATGEGKTLTIALAAVLAGWTGRPCHVVTANDYLASRDADWLRQFYRFCGLTAGCVTGEMEPQERRLNYQRDITYTTSKEVVADFLRDRLEFGPLVDSTRRLLHTMLQGSVPGRDGLVLRGLHTAIVDEADSALIDEAVTPLIISRARENEPLRQACEIAHRLSETLVAVEDYHADPRRQEIRLEAAVCKSWPPARASCPGCGAARNGGPNWSRRRCGHGSSFIAESNTWWPRRRS